MLGRLGCEVVRALDGEHSVRMARMFDAPIVFMDLNMPGTDGYEAVRIIRSEPALAKLRVVAVTGDVSEKAVRSCAEAGFDALLPKPVRIEDLEAELALARH
ncbi:response regulator [Jannaschia aquimarina]|nr:response regulator [Jannaschia aquimarina]